MSKPENILLIKTLNFLRKSGNKYNAPIWKKVRELLRRSKRKRIAVNISRINRHTTEGDIVVVPGKVLGSGFIDHKITIGAFAYSLVARKKLLSIGCTVLNIEELVNKYPRGSGVKIIA